MEKAQLDHSAVAAAVSRWRRAVRLCACVRLTVDILSTFSDRFMVHVLS